MRKPSQASRGHRIRLAVAMVEISPAMRAPVFHPASSALYSTLPMASLTNRAAQYSANASLSHCSSSFGQKTACPQYWWAISWANLSLIPSRVEPCEIVYPGFECLLRDEHGARRRLSPSITVDLDDGQLAERKRAQERLVESDDTECEIGELPIAMSFLAA